MKRTFTRIFTLCTMLSCGTLFAQLTPEVLYYNFNGSGNTVPNLASAPPPGTATANIMGGITQGGSAICQGTLIGSGVSSTTDYLNTGWAPNLGTGAWTISFRSENITPSATLFYIFGDLNSNSFRCFTNGVAGANNWILRGAGLTDVLITGGATVAPHMNTFVYDPTLNQVRAYLDGVLVNTVAQTAPNVTGTGPFKVMGYSANVGSPLNGHLDEYRIYSRALTPSEITTLNNGTVYGFLGADVNFCSGDSVALTSSATANSYAWSTGATTNSISATAGGVYTLTITGTCASGIDTIAVTENLPTTAALSPSSCTGSFIAPSGAVYTTSGTYLDTIPNSIGCDSIITITATIGNNTVNSIGPVSCGPYTAPSGAVFSTSGLFYDTIPNSSGCDSVTIINLVVLAPTTSAISASACDMYMAPSGAMYTSSGVYNDTIANMAGCDSVITIALTVGAGTFASTGPISCGPYTAPSGAVFPMSGLFYDTIQNVAGCDSIIMMNLVVITPVDTTVTPYGSGGLQATQLGATYQWIDCNTGLAVPGATSAQFEPVVNGSYSLAISDGPCADTSSCYFVITTGIEENFGGQLSMYPNPNTGSFVLNLGGTYSDVTVIITDLAGRTVFSQITNSASTINVQLDAPAGVYLMNIVSGDDQATMKVIKE